MTDAYPSRVVHLLPSTDAAGAENQARYLLAALADASEDRKLAPELVYFRPGRAHERFAALGIPMHQITPRGPLALDFPRRARALRALYRGRPPAILHVWLYEAAVVGAVAARAWPDTGVVMAQRSGTMMRADRARTLALRAIRPRVDRVLSNSRDGLDLLQALGYDPGRMAITPNALPPERLVTARPRDAVRAELGLGPSDAAVCVVGRADATKDLSGLMQALAVLRAGRPDAHLVLAGPTAQDLASLGISVPERTHALGWVGEPAEVMAACDLLVVPSWTEGHSNAADEALMLGLPVVSTNTGEHVSLVRRAGGRVVPIRDAEGLGAAMLELLRDPPDPERVRAVARAELSVGAVLAATLDCYRPLLGG